ncbi:DUF2937 family protein [Mangrovibrevibacter kandeliae]|uniref:DUF2937 family protein n=1 Tax=Mangrovibrevibacter kandeliae TaxID=2968473 RepID=UPI002117F3B3|nr:DUF2937 family protein [Aurantimonas sp. CSK15Z-1]MCQ8783430.1 DUF2937 family protein [Aurantimonas sp. CSK15Z-1]
MTALLVRVVAALLAGTLFSQTAEFTQQYLQRLGGWTDALRVEVARFDATAGASGLSRVAAIDRLRRNPDRFVARQGEDAAVTVADYAHAERRYEALIDNPPLLRPFVALGDPDWTLAGRTFDDFRPAFPIGLDGLVLTGAGFCAGWAGGAGVHGAVRMRRRRRQRAAAERATLDA